MFDLFRSREKTVRYILGGLLLIVALSMVVTLIPGFGSGLGSGSRGEQVMAKIGDEVLTEMEVRQAMQRQMRERQLPAQMAEFYVPIFVNQMVSDRAVEYQARRMGFQVSEAELGRALQSLLPMLFQDGKFAGRDAYASVLAQQGMSIPEFEANVKKQLLMNRLDMLAAEGAVVTPADVEMEFRRKNEKLKIEYFQLDRDSVTAQAVPTAAEIQEMFNRNKAAYRVPEKRAYVLFVINDDKVASTITVPEAEIRRAYEARKETFRVPERTHVRHILLKTTDKPEAEVAKIQKRMEDLLKQAKSGADFAELARKNSEDTGSAIKGGDLDWVMRGQMVPEFEKASFSLKPGEISGLVKTMYGFHIVKCDAKEDAHLRSVDEVRAELAKDLSRQQVDQKSRQLAEQVRTLAVKSTGEAEKFAAANGIQVVRVDKAAAGDPMPEVGVSADFKDAASTLPKNGVSPVVTLDGGKSVVAQVTEVYPARQAEIADVEAQLRSQVQNEKAGKLFVAKLDSAKAKFAEPAADFAKLAKEFGMGIKTPPEFDISGAVEGLGPASSLEEGFRKNVGERFGPVTLSGGQVFFCRVVAKTPADLTKLAMERDSLMQGIKLRRARERRDLFADGIVKQLTKDKKITINDAAIKRLTASFKS